MTREARYEFVLYTAVLPAYRRYCLELVQQALGSRWIAYAGAVHLDRSVRTDVPEDLYIRVTNRRLLGGRILLQTGHWREAIAATTTILDLNPRSLTAWLLLFTRRVLSRRTLVWGHLHPRRGPQAPTAALRSLMRRIADGCIVYTYDSARKLVQAEPSTHVWVAPNALYPSRVLVAADTKLRDGIIFVGRLEPEKRPELLIEAFVLLATQLPSTRLIMVGAGSMEVQLRRRVDQSGLRERVDFAGQVFDPAALSNLYAGAYCSVSPGFVGLSLTQSLGFGVPMVIAEDEPHSPEIELARRGTAVMFEAGSAMSLSAALMSEALQLTQAEREAMAATVRATYSAEAMARGIMDATGGVPGVESKGPWHLRASE